MAQQIEVSSLGWFLPLHGAGPRNWPRARPAKPPRNLWRASIRTTRSSGSKWCRRQRARTVAPYGDASQMHGTAGVPGDVIPSSFLMAEPAYRRAGRALPRAHARDARRRAGRRARPGHARSCAGRWRASQVGPDLPPATSVITGALALSTSSPDVHASDDERRSKKRPCLRRSKLLDDESPVPRRGGDGRRFRCGNIGHWARDCPKQSLRRAGPGAWLLLNWEGARRRAEPQISTTATGVAATAPPYLAPVSLRWARHMDICYPRAATCPRR